MADNRTMAELLQAPTEGYEDAIVIPEITANNFELKHGNKGVTMDLLQGVDEQGFQGRAGNLKGLECSWMVGDHDIGTGELVKLSCITRASPIHKWTEIRTWNSSRKLGKMEERLLFVDEGTK
nr:reverse transcriptase domain-containing protein [Tanacetum cinerariifolium]